MKMRNLIYLTVPALMLALSSCSIQTHTMGLEARQPSSSGVNLVGKTVAVAYLASPSGVDTVFNSNISDGFAQALEEDGIPDIPQYRLIKVPGGEYASRDTLVNLLMDTGCDVVFLFDTPSFGTPTVSEPQPNSAGKKEDEKYVYNVTIPYEVKLYAYDSMNKADTVRSFHGKDNFSAHILGRGDESRGQILGKLMKDISGAASMSGKSVASSFVSGWKPESFTFTYMDNLENAWIDGLEHAAAFEWDKAITSWESLLGTKSLRKRSAAEYNIALACFLSGEYELASKWLALSDKDAKLPLSAALHKRLQEKTR